LPAVIGGEAYLTAPDTDQLDAALVVVKARRPRMTALWSLSASRLSELLATKEVSSRDVVRAHLDRIAAVDGKLRAFTHVFHERALADAERADAERGRGQVRGALHGLPVTVKECFDIAGEETTLGIPSWRGRRATADAAIVRALRDAGAVVLGRTNLSQTMLYVESRNPLFGQTANPFSLDHTPGGSSGGEGAAIAAGMSPLGVGTDIGGSIRTPAAFCGIAGVKPTLDRFPMRGYRSVLVGQEVVRGQGGPLARTVDDLALFYAALDTTKLGALDPRVPPVAWSDPRGVPVERLRVGVYTNDGVLPASAAMVRGVERAAEILRARGCRVVPFTPPDVASLIDSYLGALSADGGKVMSAALEGGAIDDVLVPLVRLAKVPAKMRHGVARGASLLRERRLARMLDAMGEKTVEELWRLTDRVRTYRSTLLDAMEKAEIDVLLCPAFATPALPHGMSKNFTLAACYPMLFNAVQFPAGVVPVSRVRADEVVRGGAKDSVEKHAAKVDAKSAGLPVGVQVAARPWQDHVVLGVMRAIEAEASKGSDFPKTPVENL
jgi:fatty acid amide hydrolase